MARPWLFEYPLPIGAHARQSRVMRWPVDWWLRSELRLLGECEVRATAFDLFCIAQGEDPIGTLPTDNRLLARLAGVSFEQWMHLMQLDPNPLWGWEMCICQDRSTRLYHPKCLEIVREALSENGHT